MISLGNRITHFNCNHSQFQIQIAQVFGGWLDNNNVNIVIIVYLSDNNRSNLLPNHEDESLSTRRVVNETAITMIYS